MKYRDLFSLMTEAKLSPERFGDLLGASGMTLRRWRQEDPEGELPKPYDAALIDVMYRLVTDRVLTHDAESVQNILRQAPNHSISAALSNLGISLADLDSDGDHADQVAGVLARIGLSRERQAQTELDGHALDTFKRLGKNWFNKITLLREILSSSQLTMTDKLVAYGAVFYLICPFDLIPDYIPIVGLLDDYAICAIAVAYYVKRFRPLLSTFAGFDDLAANSV